MTEVFLWACLTWVQGCSDDGGIVYLPCEEKTVPTVYFEPALTPPAENCYQIRLWGPDESANVLCPGKQCTPVPMPEKP